MTEPQTYEPTRYEAVLNVRYGIRYNELNERFYRLIKGVMAFCNLFVGSAAFAGFVANSTAWIGAAGIFLAILTIIDYVLSPAEKVARFNEVFRRLTALDARAFDMTLEQIESEWRSIRVDAPLGMEALSNPAMNDNLCSNGRPECVEPLTRWERFVAWLA